MVQPIEVKLDAKPRVQLEESGSVVSALAAVEPLAVPPPVSTERGTATKGGRREASAWEWSFEPSPSAGAAVQPKPSTPKPRMPPATFDMLSDTTEAVGRPVLSEQKPSDATSVHVPPSTPALTSNDKQATSPSESLPGSSPGSGSGSSTSSGAVHSHRAPEPPARPPPEPSRTQAPGIGAAVGESLRESSQRDANKQGDNGTEDELNGTMHSQVDREPEQAPSLEPEAEASATLSQEQLQRDMRITFAIEAVRRISSKLQKYADRLATEHPALASIVRPAAQRVHDIAQKRAAAVVEESRHVKEDDIESSDSEDDDDFLAGKSRQAGLLGQSKYGRTLADPLW